MIKGMSRTMIVQRSHYQCFALLLPCQIEHAGTGKRRRQGLIQFIIQRRSLTILIVPQWSLSPFSRLKFWHVHVNIAVLEQQKWRITTTTTTTNESKIVFFWKIHDFPLFLSHSVTFAKNTTTWHINVYSISTPKLHVHTKHYSGENMRLKLSLLVFRCLQ